MLEVRSWFDGGGVTDWMTAKGEAPGAVVLWWPAQLVEKRGV